MQLPHDDDKKEDTEVKEIKPEDIYFVRSRIC